MTIKVLRLNKDIELPKIIELGDWIDLRLSKEATFKAPYAAMLKKKTKDGNVERTRKVVFDVKLLNLGIAMELPKGFEAVVLPRNSTYNKYGIILLNSEGVIDYVYKGSNDEWRFNALGLKDITIPAGDRIAQFRIQLSQKATRWQKIKWLFSNKIKIKEVDHLDNIDRGGAGTGVTGTNKFKTKD